MISPCVFFRLELPSVANGSVPYANLEDRRRHNRRYQTTAEYRAWHNEYLRNMDPLKAEARKAYQREYMRTRRAAMKAAKRPLQPVSEVSAPAAFIKPQNAPQGKPAQPEKPKSERAQRRKWSSNVVGYLIDCLTDLACPLTGQWFESHRIASMWLGFYDKLNAIEATVDDKPDVLAELRLCIAIEALRRLSGEQPAGSAPALPRTR